MQTKNKETGKGVIERGGIYIYSTKRAEGKSFTGYKQRADNLGREERKEQMPIWS